MRWSLVLLAVLSGCSEDLLADIDPFPIEVNRTGALSLMASAPDFGPAPVLVDTLTPFSVIDFYRPPGTEVPAPTRRRLTVDLVSTAGVARARFPNAAVLDMHTCGDADALCRVGIEPLDGLDCGAMPGPDTLDYQGIIGGDLLSLAALRINLLDDAAPTLQFFPDIAGDDAHYCKAGFAVIPTPLAGGSTIAIDGGEVPFGATRLPLSVCADYDPTREDAASGADLLMLMATGMGPSVMSESAWARYYQSVNPTCTADPTLCEALPYDALEYKCIQLPSGPSVAAVGKIHRFSIAGTTSKEVRGPCEERRAARLMATGGCADGDACPCENENDVRCRTAAVVELERGDAIDVAVLPDSHPMLQALREELRPGQAEVDGLLGIDALAGVQVDIDYPGQRVLYRCNGDARCTAYTEVFDENGGNAGDRCPDPP